MLKNGSRDWYDLYNGIPQSGEIKRAASIGNKTEESHRPGVQ